jgi:hypothetical protein
MLGRYAFALHLQCIWLGQALDYTCGIGLSEGIVFMLAKLPPAVPLPLGKVAGFRANRDRLLRAFAMTVTALTAFTAILLFSSAFVLSALW